MRFHDPQLLLFLLLLVPLFLLIRRRERNAASWAVSCAFAHSLPQTLRSRLAALSPYLRLPVIGLAVIALARPQMVERESSRRSLGCDLMVALDLSTSMLAREAADGVMPGAGENRLALAKEVLADFIRGRSGDRIGLVAFAARPYPAAPLTLDHGWLERAVASLETGAVEDGTALGDALLAAVNRLRDKPAQSRAVIMLTDGRSNAGAVTPEEAAAAAQAVGVRVHTIGIGSRGSAVLPVPSPLGGIMYRRLDADLDEATLRQIAAATGGSYFRADDRRLLFEVFREIDRLEKSPVQEKVFFSYRELYHLFLGASFFLLLAEILLKESVLRRIP